MKISQLMGPLATLVYSLQSVRVPFASGKPVSVG